MIESGDVVKYALHVPLTLTRASSAELKSVSVGLCSSRFWCAWFVKKNASRSASREFVSVQRTSSVPAEPVAENKACEPPVAWFCVFTRGPSRPAVTGTVAPPPLNEYMPSASVTTFVPLQFIVEVVEVAEHGRGLRKHAVMHGAGRDA